MIYTVKKKKKNRKINDRSSDKEDEMNSENVNSLLRKGRKQYAKD